jgi:hypothetical protein
MYFFLRYTITEHSSDVDGFSRFSISPVLDQDEGQITCEAANRFGRDQKHFTLSIEGYYLKILKKKKKDTARV